MTIIQTEASPHETIALTDVAAAKVGELLRQEGNPELALRVAVRPGARRKEFIREDMENYLCSTLRRLTKDVTSTSWKELPLSLNLRFIRVQWRNLPTSGSYGQHQNCRHAKASH